MTRTRIVGGGLVALAAVLLAVGVGSACQGLSDLRGRDDATTTAEAAARAFVVAYGTFDDRNTAAYSRTLASLTTGELRSALANAQVATDGRLHRRSSSHVESATTTAVVDDRAAVLVTAVQDRRWIDPASGTERTEHVRQQVTCELVREDGHWLVSALHLEAEKPARQEAR